jgi:galactokinase
MNAKENAIETFKQNFGAHPAGLAFAPGRVNLLGEHVDYNDGFVLPAAIDRATWIAFRASGSRLTTLWAADFEESAAFDLDSLQDRNIPEMDMTTRWARYPAGVAWALQAAGLEVAGMQAAFASDVPRGAGLSSSASVEVAFALAWGALGGWSLPRMDLARLCQRAENEYVGVQCGIMDQFAAACGDRDHLLHLDCRSLEWQPMPLPPGVSIVIADTSVRRSLSNSAYNDRRASCEQAVSILSGVLPGIRALRDISGQEFNRHAGLMPEAVARHARHVVEEIERTRQAPGLLNAGDAAGFGALMNACHASLRDLYEVSCPELDTMASIAQSLDGCHGARLTGAGFGGCTVNLVASESVPGFTRALAYRYQMETGKTPQIYVTHAAQGAGLA